MIALKTLLLQTLMTLVLPGASTYSVTPTACDGDECAAYPVSSYYGLHVRKESREEGAARYQTIADAAVTAAEMELCRSETGERLAGCQVSPGTPRWSVRTAVTLAFGAAIRESALREDVQVGRGQAGHPDDIGGKGRGAAGEVCLMQINPTSAWSFVPGLTPAERAAARGKGPEQAAVLDSLVGRDSESLVRCFRTGIRMLARAYTHCEWDGARWVREQSWQLGRPVQPYSDPVWAMYSLYGTGASCRADNRGATALRASMARRIKDALKRAGAGAGQS